MTNMPEMTHPANPWFNRSDDRARCYERRIWIALLIFFNLGLLGNLPTTSLIYDPTAVVNGQWWRLLTWPLVHVSRYHLLLDGVAFLLLLHGLDEPHPAKRISLTFFSAAGSLLLPLASTATLGQTGLCGLSGIAHGLAAVSALEMIGAETNKPELRKIGILLLTGLLLKSGVELWTGQVLFASLHFGSVGIPVVETHAGGILGGVFAYLLQQLSGWWMLAKKSERT
jgi:rhomboid family GlyGly-CTERM serine protease